MARIADEERVLMEISVVLTVLFVILVSLVSYQFGRLDGIREGIESSGEVVLNTLDELADRMEGDVEDV